MHFIYGARGCVKLQSNNLDTCSLYLVLVTNLPHIPQKVYIYVSISLDGNCNELVYARTCMEFSSACVVHCHRIVVAFSLHLLHYLHIYGPITCNIALR